MPNLPRIIYREAQSQTDVALGKILIHSVKQTAGLELVRVPEHSLFLVQSPVISTEIWHGINEGQREWDRDDIAFLPFNTDLKSKDVSNIYDETVIRIPDSVLRDASGCDAFLDDLHFAAIHNNGVFGVASTAVTLAHMTDVHPLVIESVSTALAAAVIHHCMPAAGKIEMEKVRSLSDSRKRKVLEFIHANLSQPITLSDMADAAALSRFHFSRSFKLAMGVSPMRYLTVRRLSMAKKMLAQSALPIVAVALACGFASQSHFCTMFKQGTGMSPSEFRLQQT